MSALLTILAGLTMTSWYIGKIMISTRCISDLMANSHKKSWMVSTKQCKVGGKSIRPRVRSWVELDDALGHLSDHHQTNWLASRSFWTGVINSLLLSQEWKWWLFMKGLKLSWKWMVSWKLGISYELSCKSKKIS